MQGLREIGPGDWVALRTGEGNSWSNDRYKSMTSDLGRAPRELCNQGEPGFGISACEYLASRDFALTLCDTSDCSLLTKIVTSRLQRAAVAAALRDINQMAGEGV